MKGGYALELKLAVARTTRDLDLRLSPLTLSAGDLLAALQDAASRETGDFFIYHIGEPTMSLDGVSTFTRRNTHAMTKELEPPPDFWKPVFEKLAAECGIDGDIQAQFEKVNRYISQLP